MSRTRRARKLVSVGGDGRGPDGEGTKRALELVGVVCHDLRTPACTIAGFADLLLDFGHSPLSADQRASLERIRKNAHFMIDLVSSLMDMVRLESGRLRLEPRLVDLRELVREAAQGAFVIASGKQIFVMSELPEQAVLAVVDRARITQVLANLLSNAVKFSAAGTTVQVGVHHEDRHVQVWVKDEGPGIPAGERRLLFGKFSRTSVRPTAGEKSTGLGLFIVKELLELHGGSIEVESSPKRGTTFRVRLPAHARAILSSG